MSFQSGQLTVLVNDKLTLNAGWWEVASSERGIVRVVHPPARTMFQQLLEYLEGQPEARSGNLPSWREEAVAMALICWCWGTYVAVLMDRSKPLAPQTSDRAVSLISDGEMKRINIEASANLAKWIEARRQDRPRYTALAQKAVAWLPATRRSIEGSNEFPVFFGLASEKMAGWLLSDPWAMRDTLRREVGEHPTRVFANALINYAWRNTGRTESLHTGGPGDPPYPLTQSRISLGAERRLFRVVARNMLEGVKALDLFGSLRTDRRMWQEKVLPYHYASGLLITPHGWSLTEDTSEVYLPGTELGE